MNPWDYLPGQLQEFLDIKEGSSMVRLLLNKKDSATSVLTIEERFMSQAIRMIFVNFQIRKEIQRSKESQEAL